MFVRHFWGMQHYVSNNEWLTCFDVQVCVDVNTLVPSKEKGLLRDRVTEMNKWLQCTEFPCFERWQWMLLKKGKFSEWSYRKTCSKETEGIPFFEWDHNVSKLEHTRLSTQCTNLPASSNRNGSNVLTHVFKSKGIRSESRYSTESESKRWSQFRGAGTIHKNFQSSFFFFWNLLSEWMVQTRLYGVFAVVPAACFLRFLQLFPEFSQHVWGISVTK